jgi:hypothetical protein
LLTSFMPGPCLLSTKVFDMALHMSKFFLSLFSYWPPTRPTLYGTSQPWGSFSVSHICQAGGKVNLMESSRWTWGHLSSIWYGWDSVTPMLWWLSLCSFLCSCFVLF